MDYIIIKDIEHLKSEAYEVNWDYADFFMILAGGLARSSKRISYRPDFGEFLIITEIDGAFQEVKTNQLGTETNLLEAISKKALFKVIK